MESLLDPSDGSRVVVTCYTGAYFLPSFPIPVWCSEPTLTFSVSAFRAFNIFSYGVQSHHRFSVLAFRAIITFQSQRSEPLFLLSLGVQSLHHFSVSAFKVIIISQLWRSEPLFLLSLGVQSRHHFLFDARSHHLFSVPAFRATTSFQFGIQSR